MNPLKALKFPLLTLLFSTFVIFITKAATPYSVTVGEFNASEFPRIQTSLQISGETAGLLAKNLVLQENEKVNLGPIALLPPHPLPKKMDLNILIDTGSNTVFSQALIKNNLKGLIQYLHAQTIDLQINISTFDDAIKLKITNIDEAFADIDKISFGQAMPVKIDGFSKIAEFSKISKRPEAQRILLVLNASAFQDNKTDGVTGMKMKEAIAAVTQNQDLTFVLGHPLQQIHTVRADSPTAELSDFSHNISGGYLGGFGADLTSLGKLLLMQSADHFVLQYYTTYSPNNFLGAQAKLFIDGSLVTDFDYKNSVEDKLILNHLPENELAAGDLLSLTVDLENKGKAINAVEMNYKNKEGEFTSLPFIHERNTSTGDKLKYLLKLPPDIFSDDYFTYYISVHTPYTSTGSETGTVTIPVNIYDDGIILTAKLSDDKKSVVWNWSGPTVEKGKQFEVWAGDHLLATTDQRTYSISLDDCNRYQILQVKVVFPDKTISNPSRPFEFFADGLAGNFPIQEKQAVELLMQCLQNKKIDSYSQFSATTSEFTPSQPLTLEKTGLYLTKILNNDLWEKVKTGSGYYELILYIMKFLNKDHYLKFNPPLAPIEKFLIYKMITKSNNTGDLDAAFARALAELSARLRGNLTL